MWEHNANIPIDSPLFERILVDTTRAPPRMNVPIPLQRPECSLTTTRRVMNIDPKRDISVQRFVFLLFVLFV